MSFRQWFRPPRHLLVLFLGTTLAFLAALGWLGWRSLEQDRNLEVQSVRERLEEATDSIAAEIRRNLADIEARLDRFSILPSDAAIEAVAAFSTNLGDNALIALFEPDRVRAFPRRRLLFYPVLPASEEPYLEAFMPGRIFASGRDDLSTAMLYNREMAASDDPRIRAEGLLGLARNQSKAGRPDAALATFNELQDPDVLIDGRPAELIARIARCDLLKTLGRQADLAKEAARLDHDLHAARWQLTGPAYQHYAAEARRLLGDDRPLSPAAAASTAALAFATAVDALWSEWRQGGGTEAAEGRVSRVFHDQPVFLIWRGSAQRSVALVAGSRFLEERIVEPLRGGFLDRQGVRVVLLDGEGQTVVSHGSTPETLSALRTMADTGLPWTLRVVSASPDADLARFAARRRLLIAGLVFLALLVLAGSYFSGRAMTREMEAARLQSEFVAAVSHEFRTPLTLLRQFSDLLADGRVAGDEERAKYYAALQRGTRRLTRLVEDLLDFARMEAGSHTVRLERLGARDWLTRLVSEFDQENRSKGYEVRFAWNGPETAVVRADEAAIGRAVWNLLDNAVKYSPDCRTIWVDGGVDNDRLTIRVRDRGLGIPAEEQRTIFRKFVRGSASNGHVKGTGLGLSLVAQIVEAHAGTIHVDSTPGEGSTFSIILPAQTEEQESRAWAAS